MTFRPTTFQPMPPHSRNSHSNLSFRHFVISSFRHFVTSLTVPNSHYHYSFCYNIITLSKHTWFHVSPHVRIHNTNNISNINNFTPLQWNQSMHPKVKNQNIIMDTMINGKYELSGYKPISGTQKLLSIILTYTNHLWTSSQPTFPRANRSLHQTTRSKHSHSEGSNLHQTNTQFQSIKPSHIKPVRHQFPFTISTGLASRTEQKQAINPSDQHIMESPFNIHMPKVNPPSHQQANLIGIAPYQRTHQPRHQ